MPIRLISLGYSQRASYSRKPLAVIRGSFSNSGVLGRRSFFGAPTMHCALAEFENDLGRRPRERQQIQPPPKKARPKTWKTGSNRVRFAALVVKIKDC